ncbi:MAG: DUF5818 domain-containing protein [Vicinamibacterales bacterium]
MTTHRYVTAAVWRRIGLLALLLSAAPPTAAQEPQTFTGVVTDEICGVGGHAGMQMGPTDGDCARACAEEHGAPFVLVDGEHVYQLSNQALPRPLAGQRVRVVGTLDRATDTIQVQSITGA